MQYLTLGRNMCQRDTGRELSECVTTSTSVSSLTAQLATSLVTEQLSRGVGTLLIELIQFHAYIRCRSYIRETGDFFNPTPPTQNQLNGFPRNLYRIDTII